MTVNSLTHTHTLARLPVQRWLRAHLSAQPAHVEGAKVLAIQQHLALQRVVEALNQAHHLHGGS